MRLFGGPPNVEKLKAKRDVPGLIKALDYQPDGSVRKAAAEALGEIGDPGAFEPLVIALKKNDRFVRQSTARALGKIGDARAVEPLIAAFRDTRGGSCEAAIDALVEIGKVAVEPLIAALAYWEGNVRMAAAGALKKIGQPAIQPLIAALKNWNAVHRKAAAYVLEALEWKPANDETGVIYWVAMQEWDRCVQMGAVAVEPLVAALDYTLGEDRQAVAEALDRLKGNKSN